VAWDLVVRPQNAYGILKAADSARRLGLKEISVLEFGVAAGAGLLNMARIAKKVQAITGVGIRVVGFDTGKGMPPAQDYRDHPEMYQESDYPMDVERLTKSLPPNAQLFIGDTKANIAKFLASSASEAPVGYVVVDVDYYSSTQTVLDVFKGQPAQYLPITMVYLDDIWSENHNSACGELLAVKEFNQEQKYRLIERHPFLVTKRILQRAMWIRQIHFLHVFDHPTRFDVTRRDPRRVHENYYLG
jgi:hypothetical protein